MPDASGRNSPPESTPPSQTGTPRAYLDPAWARVVINRDFGRSLFEARMAAGLSQTQLGMRVGLSQARISRFEGGYESPDVVQARLLAEALSISYHRLLHGTDSQGEDLRHIAIELHGLGLVDFWVDSPSVPGAARRPEELLAICVATERPDPRVIEALPALMAWNRWDPWLLLAFANLSGPRSARRLAWLAEIAVFLGRGYGFPGGSLRSQLTKLIGDAERPAEGMEWDDLGYPSPDVPKSPIWVRWKIRYDATPDRFQRRAAELNEQRLDIAKPRSRRRP